MAKNLLLGTLDHSKVLFKGTFECSFMTWLCCQTLENIEFYYNMQYQVDPTHPSPENLVFGTLDHSKMHFCYVWMILHDLVTLAKVKKHLVLSQYAISSRSNRPNSRKWPKTSVLALWIIQKCIFVIFEWTFMTWQDSQMLRNNLYNHNMQYQVHPSCQNR